MEENIYMGDNDLLANSGDNIVGTEYNCRGLYLYK